MSLRLCGRILGAAVVMTVAVSGATTEPFTERMSVDSAGVQGNGGSGGAAISADGRFVAFTSFASNLVVADTNFAFDVFVRDGLTGMTERVSVDSAGNQANGSSFSLRGAISADGRFVAFVSFASNLVPDDTNQVSDVFVHDRSTRITERVSIGVEGQGNGVFAFQSGFGAGATGVAISADGRYVAFDSYAPNLVAADTNDATDVFVRDRQAGTTERVSVDSAETQMLGNFNTGATSPAISADGRFVGFVSQATNLVANDGNGAQDVFVRDRQAGTTERVSLGIAGEADRASGIGVAALSFSEDGRFVAFTSLASNLIAGDTNEVLDVFVRDRQEGTTERVSLDNAGAQANNQSYTPAISADGRFVAFGSTASNLVTGDIAFGDVFVRDRQANTTELASVNTAGEAGQGDSAEPAISADGRFVAFHSNASNFVEADTNGATDVFVRDRGSFADTEAPIVAVPATITIDADSPAGAAVVFAASATDNVDTDVTVTCTPASGSIFPVRTTTVSCSATDDAGNTASATFDVVVLPFIVAFASFDAKVEIEELNVLELKATFLLGGRSNGIDPMAEAVSLRVGSLEVTIAAGSFVAKDNRRFRFRGIVDGIYLEAQIRVLEEGRFEFKADVPAVTGASTGVQVNVSLTIGDDTGATTATVEID